jgi:hypothetical protein
MNTQSREYVEWMAGVWKANDERNKRSLMLPNGQSYQDYCAELRDRGRTPLPYDCLWEPT